MNPALEGIRQKQRKEERENRNVGGFLRRHYPEVFEQIRKEMDKGLDDMTRRLEAAMEEAK